MKTWRDKAKPLLIAGLIVAFSAIVAYSQAGQGRSTGSPKYDPRTETTIKGVIQEVKEVAGPGRGTGTHLIVKAGSEVDEVHVGPTWYLKQQKCALAKDAEVEIIGSKVKYQGADVIIARQIKEGGNTCTLRDAQGIPAWSRGKNR